MATLLIRNLQSLVRIKSPRQFRKDVKLIRKLMNIDKFDISITCVDNEEIRRLNKEFRNVDRPTDVLSFSFYDLTEPINPALCQSASGDGGLPAVLDGESSDLQSDISDLGDLYFGMPYIQTRCLTTGFALEDELVVLTVHGFSHLLGYDHEASFEDFKRMYLFEFDILRRFDCITCRSTVPVKESTLDF